MHYITVCILIVIIILLQIRSYFSTKNSIKQYKNIFPASRDYKITSEFIGPIENVQKSPEDDLLYEPMLIEVSQLHVNTNSPVMKNIITALNNYLQKNKGAASDFHLMKDVVERYCDAEEEIITTQQPIPLYLGLMGTMVGIIVGITAIALTGVSSGGNNLMDNISELMTCVAIAMIASFFGVLCTTLIAWKSKNAIVQVESDKNNFYSWIQTELLPLLSGDATNAIYLLQQNLMSFNQTFKSNVSSLDNALSMIGDSSRDQIELIKLIRDINIRQVAQANIKVLKELKECTGEISLFNQYIHNVGGYLNAVNSLNNNLNEHLNRTAAIERMGVFFEKEIEQVSQREQYINDVVSNVDNTLKKTFEALQEGTKKNIEDLGTKSAIEYNNLSKSWDNQKEAFQEALTKQQENLGEVLQQRNTEFTEYLKSQKEIISKKADEISSLVKEIQSLSDIKTSINNLVISYNEQNKKLDALISAFSRNSNISVASQSSRGSNNIIDKILKYTAVVILIIALLAFGMYTYDFVKRYFYQQDAKALITNTQPVK